MKPFKQFFEDKKPGDKEPSDVSIVAQEPGEADETLGYTTDTGKEKIANLISRVGQNADKLIDDLVAKSAFSHPHYKKLFKAELTEHVYNVDWDAFAEHVKNREQATQLQSSEYFGGEHGDFNMYDKFAPIFGKFIRNEELLPQFFEEVFTINPSIEGTSVGDGEFLLGIIGNGFKGDKGDVDVAGHKLPNGRLEIGTELTLEVGTQNKIIGTATRKKKGDKGVPNLARNIVDACLVPWGPDRDINIGYDRGDMYQTAEQKWKYIGSMLQQYKVLKDAKNLNFVTGEMQKFSGDTEETGAVDPDEFGDKDASGQAVKKTDDYGRGGIDVTKPAGQGFKTPTQFVGDMGEQPLTRVIGAVVLYDYITEHNDDVIASINYGTAEQDTGRGWRQYDVRWANIKRLRLEGTVNLMKAGFFNFNLLPDATRFTLGNHSLNLGIESFSFKSIFKQTLL